MKVGAIAYQNVADSVGLCFLSSLRHRDTLTLPKGIVKSNETLAKAAARELFEGDGVWGRVKRKAHPLLFVSKKPEVDDILYFFVKTQHVRQNWPESDRRRRVFLTLDEALCRTTSQGTKKIINLLTNEQKLQAEAIQSNTFTVPLFGKTHWLSNVSFAWKLETLSASVPRKEGAPKLVLLIDLLLVQAWLKLC